jgi:hypothetical protein
MSELNKKVLFLGNSYVYVNDLPNVLSDLAKSGGYELITDHITRGGAKLQEFLCDGDELNSALNNKLKENQWDYVVLQEQSQVPAIPHKCQNEMYPSIRILNNRIKSCNAETILFMTWGRQFGDAKNGFKNFETMQQALKEGYTKIANEISSLIAPAGPAWLNAKLKNVDIALWDEDCSHPSIIGTYLTACVFYSLLFKESSVGLSYTAGISKDVARSLQETAFETMQESWR